MLRPLVGLLGLFGTWGAEPPRDNLVRDNQARVTATPPGLVVACRLFSVPVPCWSRSHRLVEASW